MCWFHVVLNFHKRKFNNPSNEDLMKNDLRLLHFVYDKELFDINSDLFLQKWATEEPEFTSNFETHYLQRNRNWYNGSSELKCPKTNNAIERFNGTLKQCQTHHNRKTLAVFKSDLMDIVSARSKEYINNKKFQHEITIGKDMMDAGLTYSKSNKSVYVQPEDNDSVTFFVFAGASDEKIEKTH